MTLKVNNIPDWTQAQLDAQIALGNFPAGTVLNDIVLPSDWNQIQTEIDLRVPYTGATGNVNLGAHSLRATSLSFGASGQHPIRTNVGTSAGTSVLIGLDVPTNIYTSVVVGQNAGKGVLASSGAVVVGAGAGEMTTVARAITNDVLIGADAGKNSNGGQNTFVGNGCGQLVTGSNITGIGAGAMFGAIGSTNVGIGASAMGGSNNPTGAVVGIGYQCGNGSTGAGYTFFLGDNSGRDSTNASNCFLAGSNAGAYSTNLGNVMAVGNSAAIYATGCGNTSFFGINAGAYANNVDDSAFIGSSAGSQAFNSTYVIAIGGSAGAASTGNYNVLLGLGAATGSSYYGCFFAGQGAGVQDGVSYNRSYAVVGIGANTGSYIIAADYMSAIGNNAGAGAFYSESLVAIGTNAGAEVTNGKASIMMGDGAGYQTPRAADAIFIGNYAGAYDSVLDTAYRGRPQSGHVKVQSGGTGWNIDDEATITSGSGDATIKVTGLASGGLGAVTLETPGTKYFVGDIVAIFAGNNDGLVEIATTDGDYGQIDQTNPPLLVDGGYGVGGYGFVAGETLTGQNGATIYVDAVDGIIGEVYDVTADNNGTGYTVGDFLTISAGNSDCVVEVTSIGGSGEVTAVTISAGGSAYTAGSYSTTGGTGDGFATITINSVYLGTITTASWSANGVLYEDSNNYNFFSGGTGVGCDVFINTLPYYGIPTGVNIWSAGSGYALSTYPEATSISSSYYGSGAGLTLSITSLVNGVVSTVSLLSAGTGDYIQGGQNNEHPTSATIGSGIDLYLLIHRITHATADGTSIAIGRYSGAGGFKNSISLGRGVINSATQQLNIGNVIQVEGIYNSDTQSATLQTGATGRIGGSWDVRGALQCDSITNDTGLAAGTYTPTLTGVANVTSTTSRKATYMRVGNTVTVAGQFDVTATSNNAQTIIGISLPIASNFGTAYECGGSSHSVPNTGAGHGGAIYADAANNRAEMDYYETHGGADTMCYTFTYEVI